MVSVVHWPLYLGQSKAGLEVSVSNLVSCSEQVMKAVILYTCRREMPTSNLLLMIDSPDHIFCGFPESS